MDHQAPAPDPLRKADSFALRVVAIVDDIVRYAASVIATTAIVAIFLSLMADVIVRYFTTRGLGWPAEVPNLLFPWLVMGGIVLAANRGAHIAVSILLYALSRRNARILLAAMQILVFATFAFLSYVAIDVIKITGQQLYPLTGIPQFYAYAAMIFGFVGIAVTSLIMLVRVLLADDPMSIQHDEIGEPTT